MPRRVWITAASCLLLAVGISSAHADGFEPRLRSSRTSLATEGDVVGSVRAPQVGPHAGSHGGTVIADAHGLLVVERNAGAVIRSDRQGNPVGQLTLHEGIGEMVHDGAGLVFVADRTADRVVQVDPGDAKGQGLAVVRELPLREPHGLALTPDGKTLLATSVADQQLVAIDVASLRVQWRRELTAEPRGVAVSSDGRRAAVGFLSSGVLAVVDLASDGQQVRWHSLEPRDHMHIETEEDEDFRSTTASLREARSRFQVPSDTGRRQARNVYTVGFVGDDLLVAPHQLATPQMKFRPQEDMEDSYGGGEVSIPPLVHRLAMISGAGTTSARAGFTTYEVHQPRALSYEAANDVLFVGGYGDDRVLAIHEASGQSPFVKWSAQVGGQAEDACGVDGLTFDGGELWVHCELSRRLIRLDVDGVAARQAGASDAPTPWHHGPELAASLRSPEVEQGAELFRRGRDFRMSTDGVLACASCHPEGRADGLTWRLGKSILQTPILAGRVEGTAPYKWDGQDVNLKASLSHTVDRLGGMSQRVRRREFAALRAYILSMNAPRPATVTEPDAVARGRELFVSKDLACDVCHDGDKLTDGQQYPIGKTRFGGDRHPLVGRPGP
ncbi:MAG: hypothetical protein AAF799_03480 [Myxococcota bacterium]